MLSKSYCMKVFLSITSSVLFGLFANAQEPADALRSSWNVQGGSARVQAIGGSMGSLGGDITATFVNPAGLGFYRTGDLILSPAYQRRNTSGTYYGKKESREGDRFTWGTSGFVIGGGSGTGKIKTTALSIAYNRAADFNSNFEYRGLNNQSSYSQKFLEEIKRNNIRDGNELDANYEFGPSLAFRTYYIDTIGGSTNGNFQFQSRAANLLSTGLLQQNSVQTRGGIDEVALAIGGQVNEKWLVGGTIGVPIMHYRRDGEFLETDATNNANNKFDYAIISEKLRTGGVGFNAKLGAIYKPSEFWRLGLAFHSPSIYSLTDKYETSVTADVESPSNGPLVSDSKEFNGGNPAETKYGYISPYRVIGSISYVLREIQDVRKQRGFLTADVEFINYKASSYFVDEEDDPDGTNKAYYKELNKAINQAYKGAFNFRAGGELKFTTVMVRAGVAYYGNPYKDLNGEKGSKFNVSGGLGYRNKGFFVDLTYVHSLTKDVNFAYRLAQSPYAGAQLRTNAGTGVVTFGFKI